MPEIFSTGSIKGFYFGGFAELPVPILPTIDVDFVVASAYFIPTFGGNLGFGANFADNGAKFQIDAKAFLSLKLGFDVDLIAFGLSSGAHGKAYAFGSGNFDVSNGNFGITGGGGIGLGGNVHIWTIACLSECDIFNMDLDENYEIGCKINNPGGIKFYVQ